MGRGCNDRATAHGSLIADHSMNWQTDRRILLRFVETMPRIFWIIVGTSTLLALILLLFLVWQGYQDGLQRVKAQERQQIAILLQNATDLRNEGLRKEALVEYRKLLEINAQNEAALNGISALLDAPETPTPLPTPSPAPVTAPNPIEIIWADAQTLYNAGRWQEAIKRMLQIQATQADFHQEEREEMLYTAYVSLAMEKSNAGSLEEAVQTFDKALALRPDAVQIQAIRAVTAQYLDALTYQFANWPKAIELLGDLYRRSPGYRDVRQRLQEAYIEYGKYLARQEDWCTAADQYTSAIAVLDGPGLKARLDALMVLCKNHTTSQETE